MGDDFTSSQPIYLQLVGRICKQIVRGELSSGDKLASVREMAIQSGVNPNTMSRVYSELERMGVVETRRGQGTFVTTNQARLYKLRSDLQREQIESFVRDMREMGFADNEIVAGIQSYLHAEDFPKR